MGFIFISTTSKTFMGQEYICQGSIGSQSFSTKSFRYNLQIFTPCKALPGFFLCIFSSLTCLQKPVFSKQDLLWWKVSAVCTMIFWPAEGTSQPVTISKKWTNPSSTLFRKRTGVHALQGFLTCSLGVVASLGHRSEITEGTQALLLYFIHQFEIP